MLLKENVVTDGLTDSGYCFRALTNVAVILDFSNKIKRVESDLIN